MTTLPRGWDPPALAPAALDPAPVLLWSSDFRDLATAALPTSATDTEIDGLTFAVSAPVGTPTTWSIVNGVGILIAGSDTRGRLVLSWERIEALMLRPLSTLDQIIVEMQVGEEVANGTLSVNLSGVELSVVASLNQPLCTMTRASGVSKRRIGRYTTVLEGGSLDEAAVGRSFSMRVGPGGHNAIAYVTDAELDLESPMTSATSRKMVGASAGTGTAEGPWSNQGSSYWLLDLVDKNDAADIAVEAMAIFLIPGSEYSAP